jgi:hypothetical protein
MPSGHSTTIGAQITIIKAMFDLHEADDITRKPYPSHIQAVQSNKDGTELEHISSSGMTIIGELNKLAMNIGYARDSAGLHYSSDNIPGMKLGEDIAISLLIDKASEILESSKYFKGKFNGWLLEKFDGKIIRITSKGIITVK